jgi:hypothetical protein
VRSRLNEGYACRPPCDVAGPIRQSCQIVAVGLRLIGQGLFQILKSARSTEFRTTRAARSDVRLTSACVDALPFHPIFCARPLNHSFVHHGHIC